ncbi:MAG: sulfotransferase [Promethearchaeota archaeon]|nr:MAG: sulfotransferase [Candidatus Lokiarchaeota archaeon]
MVNLKISTKDATKVSYFGFYGYVFSKIINSIDFFSDVVSLSESIKLYKKIRKDWNNIRTLYRKIELEKPIYITGLARSGTTITLEMLSNHPDLASHQYKHLVMPYLPYWFDLMLNRLKISTESFERFHQDRIIINQNSPEAVEEILWQKFFENLHNEEMSNILSSDLNFPEFESFYRNHIQKLLIGQKASRYLGKNNYNITRLNYILKIFPKARFIIMIRDPLNQIASLIKQHNLFLKMELKNPYIIDWLSLLGHHEFGVGLKYINIGNTELIHKIRKLMKDKRTSVKAWAYYWNYIYKYISKIIENNQKIKDATLIINYSDLCENSEYTINQILDHVQLSHEDFQETKNLYCERLSRPNYYSCSFTKKERNQIIHISGNTAKKFGLDIH